jgi:hypothetical protein
LSVHGLKAALIANGLAAFGPGFGARRKAFITGGLKIIRLFGFGFGRAKMFPPPVPVAAREGLTTGGRNMPEVVGVPVLVPPPPRFQFGKPLTC